MGAIGDDVGFDAAVASGQLPRGHASGGELGYLVLWVDAADSDHVRLVGGIVEGAVEGAVVADSWHQDDAFRGDFPHFACEGQVLSIREYSQFIPDNMGCVQTLDPKNKRGFRSKDPNIYKTQNQTQTQRPKYIWDLDPNPSPKTQI